MRQHPVLGLQAFWRSAGNVKLVDRASAPEIEAARLKLADLYQKHRVTGKVLEQRLKSTTETLLRREPGAAL
jgi:hypothetical protein